MESVRLTQKRRAVITGAGGLIGSHLVQTASQYASCWEVIGLTRQDLDLTDVPAVRTTWRALKPQLLIHCAALSKPQFCQANPDVAHKVNVESTTVLARLAKDIPFIFFSSDQVFDGRHGRYDESAQVNPINVYGETKVAAEQIVLANLRHTAIRTSLNGGVSPTGDRAFNEEIRTAWQANRMLRLFTDEFRCPIPAVVTARAVWELVEKNEPGLYHLAGSQRLSRWQIGEMLAARWPHLNHKMEPGSVHDYVGPARPPDLSLDCSKVQELLSFPLPGLSEWLNAHPDEPF